MSDEEDEELGVMIDNGSGVLMAGFIGDDAPRVLYQTAVGRPEQESYLITSKQDVYVGDELDRHRTDSVLSISYPIEHGIITNWDDMEKIWHHTYDELRVKPEQLPAFMTESLFNPVSCREITTQVMFETFGVPKFYLAQQAKLALHASGTTTGLIVESGDGVTQVLPVYEGYVLRAATRRIDFGGRDLTHYLSRLLYQRGYSFTTSAEMEIVRELKEKLCEVSEEEVYPIVHKSEPFTLPNGTTIRLGKERLQCPEAMFNPTQAGYEFPGFPQLIHESLMECDIDTRRDLLRVFILSGGNTKFPGFPERVKKEIVKMVPATMKVHTIAAAERRFYSWIGGSYLASGSSFEQMWVTREEYLEHGPGIVHRKCTI